MGLVRYDQISIDCLEVYILATVTRAQGPPTYHRLLHFVPFDRRVHLPSSPLRDYARSHLAVNIVQGRS